MYNYRKLSKKQQEELVAERLAQGFPAHSPPHPLNFQTYYLLTAACYQHQPHVSTVARRQQLLDLIFERFTEEKLEIRAWVILPNHYHLLVFVNDFKKLGRLFNRIHGKISRQWNQEDQQPGRKIWYRYTDRMIRSERHYYTTLNYLHYNPVKHGHTTSPYNWEQSSVKWYLQDFGRDWLRDCWVRYPVRDYGTGWDDSS